MNLWRLSLGGMILLAGCTEAPPQKAAPIIAEGPWQEFKSPSGGYAITVPALPIEVSETIASDLGTLPRTAFTLKVRQGRYSAGYLLSYVDYPKGGIAKIGAKKFLDSTWDGASGPLRDSVIYKKTITVEGHPGLEFQYKKKVGLVTSRNFVVGDRFFQLSAVMTPEQAERGDAMKYLQSFRLAK